MTRSSSKPAAWRRSRTDVVATRNAIDASVGQWTGALSYGLSDRLDLSLAVPIVHTQLHVISAATIERVGTGEAHEIHFFRDPDAAGGMRAAAGRPSRR